MINYSLAKVLLFYDIFIVLVGPFMLMTCVNPQVIVLLHAFRKHTKNADNWLSSGKRGCRIPLLSDNQLSCPRGV